MCEKILSSVSKPSSFDKCVGMRVFETPHCGFSCQWMEQLYMASELN